MGTFFSFSVLVLRMGSMKSSWARELFDTDRLTGNTNSWCHHFGSVPRQIQDDLVLCLHLCGWSLHTVLHFLTLGNRAWRSLGWLDRGNGKIYCTWLSITKADARCHS